MRMRLVMKNLLRNQRRTPLTTASAAVAIGLVSALLSAYRASRANVAQPLRYPG